jgi:hypothetical protein
MSKSAIMSIAFTILVAGLIFYSMRGVTQVTCEVCITWKGQKECRTGQGRTREEAITKATEACCAVMPTDGMAERIQCSDTVPTSVSCD